MAILTINASRIKVWRDSDIDVNPQAIDPTGPTNPVTGVLLGYLTKRIFIKAGVANGGNVRIWDQSTSPAMYYELDAGQEVILRIDSSLLVNLSGSAVDQEVFVLMELEGGGQ